MSCRLEAVGFQFEPYWWRPCGVTWDLSRTVVVIKLRRTSALYLYHRSHAMYHQELLRLSQALTWFAALTLAFFSTSSFTTARCPPWAEAMRLVEPSCNPKTSAIQAAAQTAAQPCHWSRAYPEALGSNIQKKC